MAEPHEPASPLVPQEPGQAGPVAGGQGDAGARRYGEPPGWVGGGLPAGPVGDPWPGGGGDRRGAARPLRNPLPPAEPSRRALGLEMLAMLVLAYALPILGLFADSSGPVRPQAIAVVAGAAFQWFPIAVLYALLRRRGGWGSIGLNRLDGIDATAGVLMWLASHATVLILALLTQGFGRNDVEFLPRGLPVWELGLLSLLIAVTAGFVEEIMFRGYVQTRLQQLRVPAAIVVLAPTAFWAVLHLYQGAGPAVTIFGLGMLYAIWFQWTRRLWPVIIAHLMFNFTTLVLIIRATVGG